VLAASVNFEVKLELVAFVKLAHARTLDCADMHKGIGLTIIARNEAKALHRVEELHRAGCPFARQLALRRSRLSRHGDDIAQNLKISSRDFTAAINQIELKLLALGQAFKASALDRADVDEHILAAIFALDEAEAFLRIEKLDDTFAGANDLGGHTAATAAAARTAAWSAEAATAATRCTPAAKTTAAAAKSAAITAAKAAPVPTTDTTARCAATKAAAAAAAVGIETALVTETIALVASATPPPSVKTHKNQ
jgi:hypothetical protein